MIATAALFIGAGIEAHGRPRDDVEPIPFLGIVITMAFDYLMLATVVGAFHP